MPPVSAPAVKTPPVTTPAKTATAPPVQTDVKSTAPAAPAAVDSSNLTTAAETPNPFASFAPSATEVTVDGWKEGKNDSLESILKNQGYSLNDIYSKDENGKTMIDKVAAANDLKNPNVIGKGDKLQIPKKENTESISTQDLDKGQTQTAEATNGEASVEATNTRNEDGTATSAVEVSNGDASLDTTTNVSENGRIDTSVSHTEDSVSSNTVAIDGANATEVSTVANDEGTNVTVTDRDGTADTNLTANADAVTTTNGGITNEVDISESNSDGFFEDVGRGITNFFTGGPEQPEAVDLDGVRQVGVNRDNEGQTTVSADGKEVLQTAGDTDDGWLERAGEGVDNFFRGIGNFFSSGDSGTERSEVRDVNPTPDYSNIPMGP